jgi:hypothetical protein
VIDPADGERFVDAIDELRIPCGAAAEHARNATVDEQCPVNLRDLQLVVRYQDDMSNMWTEPRDWRGLQEAVIEWRHALDQLVGIEAMQQDVLAHSTAWFGFYHLSWNLATAPPFVGTYGPWIRDALNLQFRLQDQIGLFAMWMSRYRHQLARDGLP